MRAVVLGTHVIIIAVHSGMNAALHGITLVYGARVLIITIRGCEHASFEAVASCISDVSGERGGEKGEGRTEEGEKGKRG